LPNKARNKCFSWQEYQLLVAQLNLFAVLDGFPFVHRPV
jgi:hypothetical protein